MDFAKLRGCFKRTFGEAPSHKRRSGLCPARLNIPPEAVSKVKSILLTKVALCCEPPLVGRVRSSLKIGQKSKKGFYALIFSKISINCPLFGSNWGLFGPFGCPKGTIRPCLHRMAHHFFMLWAMASRFTSVPTPVFPLSRNRRNWRQYLMCPNTGSVSTLR